ncbi:MAG: LmbU family transcriptional regulator, partial [Actinomycetota bacterium]|nr:LmbU family transcriptional regulator [Actinomycetota bacterium]
MNGALTPTAWVPGEDMRFRDWAEHGRRLGIVSRGVGWWIGDWLRYGNTRFGQRYARASRITGYDVQTLMNMVYVASAYDPEDRRANLSFSHHAEVAALPREQRERWLDEAEANRLSVRCLREEVRRARRLAAAEPAGLERGEEPEDEPAAQAADDDESALRCPRCGCEIHEPAPLRLVGA